MQSTMSKSDQYCIFVMAALGGSISAGAFAAGILLGASSGTLSQDAGWEAYVGPAVFLLGVVVLPMVGGAWSGALACAVWRSPAGKRIFSTLSGGVFGGMLSLFLLWPISAGVPLFPTVAGLLVGDLVGRCIQLRAERALHTLTEGLD
jgi:hypothetical protein